MRFIERLKTRPEGTKRRYAFMVAFVATLFVGVGWSTSLPARYANVSNRLDATGEQSGIGEIVENVGSQLGSVRESVEGYTNGESPEGDTIPQDRYLDELKNSVPETSATAPLPETVVAPSPTVLTPGPLGTTSAPSPSTPPNIILMPKTPEGETATQTTGSP